jgi:hypothetical protein
MRNGTKYLKRLIAALTIAGLLAFALPASASSNSYTVHHCTQWEIDGINHHMVDFWHQVHMLAHSPSVVRVRNRAIALLANDTQHRRTALDNACWTVPGMGP